MIDTLAHTDDKAAERYFRHGILPLKDRLFRTALRITLDRAEAEDITQETLVRLWERRAEWAQIGSIEAYALTVTRRLALDATRMQTTADAHGATTLPPDVTERVASPALQPDEQLDQRMRVERVYNLIDALPEVQRTIVQLRDIEGLRYDEIAHVTGLTETQVKVYLHRARKKIREQL